MLEYVVARRLAYIALKYEMLSLLNFSAIPWQSTIDVIATFTYDIEKAFPDQEVLTALAFNIKKAFDKVTKASLILRL